MEAVSIQLSMEKSMLIRFLEYSERAQELKEQEINRRYKRFLKELKKANKTTLKRPHE